MLKISGYHKIPTQVIIKLAISILIWIAAVVILISRKDWTTGSGGSRIIILITGVLVFTNVYSCIKKYAKDQTGA